MAANESKYINIQYERADGKNHMFRVADFKNGVTDLEIKGLATGILTEDIFAPEGHSLAKLIGMEKVVTTRSEVTV